MRCDCITECSLHFAFWKEVRVFRVDSQVHGFELGECEVVAGAIARASLHTHVEQTRDAAAKHGMVWHDNGAGARQ
tara:strand:+ start:1219 stop:1446 length:228 start_codon:yes stop_codon:yes gene_type:complete